MALRKRRPGLVYPVWEEWHYVGEAGEPAFENSWSNTAGSMGLAYRIRETGVVDIQGRINGGTTPSTVFTLPAPYRPTGSAWFPAIGLSVSGSSDTPILMTVSTAGAVGAINAVVACNAVWLAGQFFFDPPVAAP